jgi:hypothetical protein
MTYWTTLVWKDLHEKFDGDVIHMMTMNRITFGGEQRTEQQRAEKAMSVFGSLLGESFSSFDSSLE